MSEQETLLTALSRIAQRARRNELTRLLVNILCWILATLLVYQILHAFTPRLDASASSWTGGFAVAAALCGIGYAIWAARRRSPNLARAAGLADERAELKDELKSAYWFAEQRMNSALVGLQLHRAAERARQLDAAKVVPVTVPRSVAWVIALSVLLGATVWLAPRIAHTVAQRKLETQRVQALAQARQQQKVRDLLPAPKLAEGEPDQKLNEAAQASAKPGAAPKSQAAAAAPAAPALAKETPDIAAAWRKLDRASASVEVAENSSALGKAIEEHNARKTVEMLHQLAKAQVVSEDDLDQKALNEAAERVRRGEGFIPRLSDLFKQGDDPFDNERGSKAGIADAVSKGEKKNERRRSLEQVSSGLRHMDAYSASISRDPVIEATRFGGERGEPPEGIGSQQTGSANIRGGVMHRRAAMTKGNPSEGGSRLGESDGEGEAEAVLGKKTQRLDAQLKRFSIGEEKRAEGEEVADNFFGATRSIDSTLAYEAIVARATRGNEEALDAERIPLRYRGAVKEYFVQIHQREK